MSLIFVSHYWFPFCRQERMLAKRKRTLRASKSTDDSIAEPAVPSGSPISQLKKRVNDSITALGIDIPDTPGTPSPLTDPCDTLGGATITTVESGFVTSPRSLDCIHSASEHCQCFYDDNIICREKLKATRTDSDILNQNYAVGISNELNLNTTYHDIDT